MMNTVLYTLGTAVFSTLLSALIGIPTAFFVARRRFLGRRLLISLSAVPLCIPALIVALAYVSFWGVNGVANNILQRLLGQRFTPLRFLYSTTGIIISQGFYNFPLITKIVSDAWSQLPQEQEDAARLLGAGASRLLFTITLPRLAGAVAAACIPVFLFCFFSFMIVLLFSPSGHSTIEVEIYHAIRTTLDVRSGALLAVLEALLALSAVAAYTMLTRKSQTASDGLCQRQREPPRLCRQRLQPAPARLAEGVIFFILAALILLFFLMPAAGIAISSFSVKKANQLHLGLAGYKALLGSKTFWRALRLSLITGCFTGFLCALTGFSYSVMVKLRKRQSSVLLQTLPLLPMVISSVVLAWILGLIFHRGNLFLLILGQVMLNWPVAYRQIQNGINRLSLDTDRAAAILSKNPLDSVIRVYLPACRRVLRSAFGFCFAISLGDASLPLVLSIPNFTSLALLTYRLAGSYRFNQACACGCILAALSMLIFSLLKRDRVHNWQNRAP